MICIIPFEVRPVVTVRVSLLAVRAHRDRRRAVVRRHRERRDLDRVLDLGVGDRDRRVGAGVVVTARVGERNGDRIARDARARVGNRADLGHRAGCARDPRLCRRARTARRATGRLLAVAFAAVAAVAAVAAAEVEDRASATSASDAAEGEVAAAEAAVVRAGGRQRDRCGLTDFDVGDVGVVEAEVDRVARRADHLDVGRRTRVVVAASAVPVVAVATEAVRGG